MKEVYDKYLHPNVLPINDQKVWKALQDSSILDIFQFNTTVGIQAAKKTKPTSIQELSQTNGLMRLMTSEKGQEMPIDKYVRFKNNISLWYDETRAAGLTPAEQKILEPYFLESKGIIISQESLMLLLMDENICGFSLAEANEARKIIGKKQMSKIPELREKILTRAKSKNLGEYVWTYGAGPQMGYSFSEIHSCCYSFIGFQTMFIASYWNPIYWNTACLIVNSGSLQEEEENDKERGTNYTKIAKALGDIISHGIKVSLVDINKSNFGFEPDVENNQILFGLKGLLNVGDDVVNMVIENRPYASIKDFYQRVPIKKQSMISLIKGGAFDNMHSRKFAMAWYLWETCDKKKRITLQNMNGLIKRGLVPKDEKYKVPIRVFEFNRYLKSVCKADKDFYKLDNRAIDFLNEIGEENLIVKDFILSAKRWDSVYQKYMDVLRDWMKLHQAEILQSLNESIFKEDWDKYARDGNLSSWEMEVLCFYFHEHELQNVNNEKYGISDFYSLSEFPVVTRSFKKEEKVINIYEIYRICGTCIGKDKIKSTVTLLTPSGVVEVKFRKEFFAIYDKQISQRQPDGTKKIMERSWFNRGSMIMVQGIRTNDTFMAKKYSSTPGHTLYKIDKVEKNGNIVLRSERVKGELEDE